MNSLLENLTRPPDCEGSREARGEIDMRDDDLRGLSVGLMLEEFSGFMFESPFTSLCVLGSMPMLRSFFLMHEFQKFLISLSVRPGSWVAICDHLQLLTHQTNQHMFARLHRSTAQDKLIHGYEPRPRNYSDLFLLYCKNIAHDRAHDRPHSTMSLHMVSSMLGEDLKTCYREQHEGR